MAHEVENMMYVGATPWHELGVKLDRAPTSREAITAAGCDWRVGLKPLFTEEHAQVSHKAVYRETDGRILGVVGPGWMPLQNESAFAWFDPFLESGEATIETAGSLRDGARVWVLAKITGSDIPIVPQDDDRIARYILLANGHDGVLGCHVGYTPVRVVCANTLAMAREAGASKLLRIQHRKNIAQTLDDVRGVMNTINQTFEATAEQYRMLAQHGISGKQLEKYVQRVFGTRVEVRDLDALTPEQEEELKGKGARVLDQITPLFESGRGNDLPGVRGTWWAAFNGVTEYVTHARGSDASKRLDAVSFGDGARLIRRALDVAVKMAVAA